MNNLSEVGKVIHPHHKSTISMKGINLAFWLTLALFIVEIIGGLITNSLAILSDAWHLLSDILALGISWFALWQATKPANKKLTYGYHRLGIFAAFINNLTLIGISGFIFYKAIQRLYHPQEVESLGMIYLAVLGVAVSALIVFFLRKEEQNINVKSAVLHFVGDVFSYAGVIIGGILLFLTNWLWIDALISMIFASIILRGALKMLLESIRILLEAVPEGFDIDEIKGVIKEVNGVYSVHDVHVWGISSDEIMLTAHLVVENISIEQSHQLLSNVKKEIRNKYKIWHSNFQLETRSYQQNKIS